MIRLAVLSGKGGTGKTVVSAALAGLLPGSKVFADCDVEAANLALLLAPHERQRLPFFGMKRGKICENLCVACGLCSRACRFGAIYEGDDGIFIVDPLRCEGCAVCRDVCPEGAVSMVAYRDGEIIISDTALGPLVYAELCPGSGNSGLLVNEVKKTALEEGFDRDLLLIDGPPGIGCPVISTMSGISEMIVVTEPGISALHDLERLVKVSRGFSIHLRVIINKSDLNPDYSARIDEYCSREAIAILGRIPFDSTVQQAVMSGVPVTKFDCPATAALKEAATRLGEELRL